MNGAEKELYSPVGLDHVLDKEEPPCGFDDTVPVGGHVGTGDNYSPSKSSPPKNPRREREDV